MTYWTLVKRGLTHYWRTHLGVVAGAIVATTVLVGALVIGDSMAYTLRRFALARLGETRLAMATGDRYFPTGEGGLARRLSDRLDAPTAPVLQLRGSGASADRERRANQMFVHGVDERFWAMGGADPLIDKGDGGEVVLNERAARRLGVETGDRVLLRFEKPSALPQETALASDKGAAAGMELTVRAVASEEQFGRFSLIANQIPPASAFVPLEWLQKQVDLENRANILLVGKPKSEPEGEQATSYVEVAREALREVFRLRDAGLAYGPVRGRPNVRELTSERVFMSRVVAQSAARTGERPVGVLTYLVNTFRHGEAETPYSMAAAMGPLAEGRGPESVSPVPPDMVADEIVINEWLAEDLAAEVGDEVELAYYVLGPRQQLVTKTRDFTVRKIAPLEGPAADPTLMPSLPGVAGESHIEEWEPEWIKRGRIRERDETYWEKRKGTPKAFVTLAAGREMWANRFGNLTGMRWSGADAPTRAALRGALDPEALGLFFLPARASALEASEKSDPFGVLFLSLSMFLLFAALILMALLFVFGVEQRAGEVGTLKAVGYRPAAVRRLFLAEGGVLAAIGAVIGLGGGLAYTLVLLEALATVWSGAIGGTQVLFHVTPGTLAIGVLAGIGAAVLAMLVTLRRQIARPARELVAGGSEFAGATVEAGRLRRRLAGGLGSLAIIAAVGLVAWAMTTRGQSATYAFFTAGFLLLVGTLAVAYAVLTRMVGHGRGRLTVGRLGVRNAARRRGRSLATMALLACGSFMVVAVGANRRSVDVDPRNRQSGTGGFALHAQSTFAVYGDPDAEEFRAEEGLAGLGEGVKFVPFRVREGDDASCLNLNRAQQPRLMGVDPAEMARRDAFSFKDTLTDAEHPWKLLRWDGKGPVPAIVDGATLQWSLYKKLGQTISYTDDQGRPFEVKFVAALAPSILQGSVIIGEEAFLEKYPSAGGYKTFLVDVPQGRIEEIAKALRKAFRGEGMEVTPTTERLRMFFELENTYLSIFQLLGGLGMLIGSIGLGLVVLRNVLERRGELALMRAVGYRRSDLKRLILAEHVGLLAAGLVCGTVSAAVAVAPVVEQAGTELPLFSLGVTLGAVLASGLLWTYLATTVALRGPLMEALRSE